MPLCGCLGRWTSPFGCISPCSMRPLDPSGNGWLTDRKPKTARDEFRVVTIHWRIRLASTDRVVGDLVKSIEEKLDNEQKVHIYCRCGRGRSGIVIFLVMRCLGYPELTCLPELKKMSPDLHAQFIIKPSEDCTLHWMARRTFNDNGFRRCIDGAEGEENVDLDNSSGVESE